MGVRRKPLRGELSCEADTLFWEEPSASVDVCTGFGSYKGSE